MIDDPDIIEILPESLEGVVWQPVIGPVTLRLRDHFVASESIPTKAGADVVIREAYGVLAQCSPPQADQAERTGLVCGYVQSGKTGSMTAVSALGRDNKYRIIILIAGTTTNLVQQNSERVERDLRAAAPDWSWLMLENPRRVRDGAELAALAQEWRSAEYEESDRRTLFITVMKNHTHLRALAEFLDEVDLSSVPAIIFDDEADQASLNTRPRDGNASATYRMIQQVRQQLPLHSYLQYTATPQAPLLITRIDSLSADFAELLSPGDGYVGGRTLFGQTTPYVELIPPSEVFRDGHLPSAPPGSLLTALQEYFIGVAAGRVQEASGYRSMLIHPSKATATHRHYRNWVNNVKAHWHRTLTEGAQRDRDELLEEFHAAYDGLSRTCDDLPSMEEIQAKLPVAMGQTTVTLVNSVDGREVPWRNGYSHILVGGEKLGRGYTIKGLTVTYMPRSPGGWTADTIQQRARFFGYHEKVLGYCRVYLHPDVRNVYVTYVDHEEDMRARLAEHRGMPLRDWRRLFYLNRRLAPTRKNVLTSPYDRPRFAEGWFSPKAPHRAPGNGLENAELVALFQAVDFADDPDHPQHELAWVRLDETFEHFLIPFSYLDAEDALGLCVVNCNLKTLLEREPDASCVIYRMNKLQPRERSLAAGRIPQFFQGRSSAGADSYPGDRAIFNPRWPTIQIHALRILDGSGPIEGVPAIAVRLPSQRDVLVHDEPAAS